MASSDGMFIPKRMHRSPAFRKLTANAILILLEFLSRRQLVKVGRRNSWVTKNNGEIVLTYSETTKKFGISRSTFRNSIDQLVTLGFIDIAHHGGGMMKDCSKYSISERWRDYGKEEFKNKSRQKDTRKLGFQAGDKWEKQTGRKRKSQSKISSTDDTRSSITNDTHDRQMPATPSINHTTHQTDPNYYIQKGLELLKAMYPARYH